ncbi:MAG TPA: VanZ family protein [Candidatus Bathyarchaeia archaeon]|nr:VanZ family protein [Candidatus Bathyarchaeia archaeon]
MTIVYSGGILWFSFQPGEEVAWSWMGALGDLLHIPAYFGLAWLMMLSYVGYGERRTDNGERKRRDEGRITEKRKDPMRSFDLAVLRTPPSVLIFLTATVYGVINEFIQAGVPGRFFSVGDMLRNALGAGLAVWLFRRVRGFARC